MISEESKTSGGSKILYGKFYHHQAKKSKNNKEGMDEESSAGDMEQHEHAGKQRITSLTTNKNVATASRPPLGSSVPGASAAGSSSEPTVGRSAEEQAHATTSSRDETRNKVSIGSTNKLEAYALLLAQRSSSRMLVTPHSFCSVLQSPDSIAKCCYKNI